MKRLLKRLSICFMMLLSLTVFMQVTPASAADDQEVTIYDIRSDYGAKVKVPADLPKEYQIPDYVRGTRYEVVSGSDSVTVSAKGLVTAKRSYWKIYENGWVLAASPSNYDYYTITPGDAVIEITYKGETKSLTVHLVNYESVYVDHVIQDYIDANIKDDMSDMDLVNAIAKFAAQYDYLKTSSSLSDMVILKSCNDKAATEAVVKLSEKLGYDAWSIDETKKDSSRKLALVKINDQYYQIDAGLNQEKDSGYRPYAVTKRNTLFRYELDGKNAKITSYDGKESPKILEVPSRIDGYTVTGIGFKGLGNLDCTKIVLPDTLKTLDGRVFYNCKNLKELEIPASVDTISAAITDGCINLDTLTVAKDNPTFMSKDNAIYSKDETELVTVTIVSEFKVPDTVTVIGPDVFFNNTNLISVEIPSSVVKIGDSAFNSCKNLRSIQLPEKLVEIGENCFWGDDSLSVVRIPATVTNIGYGAFLNCKGLTAVYFYGDLPQFQSSEPTMRANMIFSSCRKLKTAYYPNGNTTWTADGVAKKLSYQVETGKTLTWSTWDPSTVQSISSAQITLPAATYTYTGTAFTPAITVTLQGKTLTNGTDYVVSYFDNINAGTAQIQVTGCGSYEGVAKNIFQINKGSLKETPLVTVNKLMVGKTARFTKISSVKWQFQSDNIAVATVTSEGVITAIAPGTVQVTAIYPGDENYNMKGVSYSIEVIADPNATPIPVPTATPGAITTATPGAITTATPGAVTTATPGAVTTATPGAVTTATPGAVTTAKPGESSKPAGPSGSGKPDVTAKPGESDKPNVPTAAPGESGKPAKPSASPSESNKPNVPTAAPGGSDKPANPSAAPGASKKPSSTAVPTQKPTSTKAPSSTSDGKTSVTVGSTVTYKNAKYRITGKNTAEFVGIVKGKTVNIPDTITVGGKVYKITSIAAKACRDNTKITKLVIGKNVKKIGKEAFRNCTKLKSINCKTKLLKAGKVKKNAFKGVNKKVVLKVPKAQKSLYKKLFIF